MEKPVPGGPVSLTEGVKYDDGKLRTDLLQIRAIEAVAEIMAYGAKKYEARNWENGMSWGRLFGAALRHLFQFWRGEDTDPESGHLHLAHAAWNVLSLLEYVLTGTGTDDRSKLTTKPPHRL